jgi:hypothetical protein
MRNEQKHINVTVANQFTVQKTSYGKFFSSKKEQGKTPSGVFPTFHRYQKIWGLVVRRREANLRRATQTIMHNNFRKIECI